MKTNNDLHLARYGKFTCTPTFNGFPGVIHGIAYGNAIYVAIGELDTIFTSSDGTTWCKGLSNTTESLTAITYGNGLFVAVGEVGTIISSPDGIIWTQETPRATNDYLCGVAYGNDLFVAVGRSGTIITSPDTITWSASFITGFNSITSIIYADGLFVISVDDGRTIIFPMELPGLRDLSPKG